MHACLRDWPAGIRASTMSDIGHSLCLVPLYVANITELDRFSRNLNKCIRPISVRILPLVIFASSILYIPAVLTYNTRMFPLLTFKQLDYLLTCVRLVAPGGTQATNHFTCLHPALSCAAASIFLQLYLYPDVHISFSRSLFQVFLGRPLPQLPYGVHCIAPVW